MSSVGVLLPARLETRFDQDSDSGHWVLRVLVVPGAASLDSHDDAVDVDELLRLEAAASACQGRLAHPEGLAAFEQLAAELGAGRAAWLVRTRLRVDGDEWQVLADAAGPRQGQDRPPTTIRGLPPELELWADDDGGASTMLTTFHPIAAALPITPEADESFWASWDTLEGVGLATSIDLDEQGIDPAAIARLTLVGLHDPGDPDGPGGTGAVADLFSAQVSAGRAALLRPGTPTNVTDAGGHPRPTAADWHVTLTEEPSTWGESSYQGVARALTGRADGLPRLVGGDAHSHRFLQQAVVRSLWPALWGHAAQDLWGPEQWTAQHLGGWVSEHLLPHGPYPTLLVGDQPLAVLPLTPLGQAADGSHPVEDALAPALVEALRLSDALASEDHDTVIGADAERLLRVVGTPPSSLRWSWRWSLPLRLLTSGLAQPGALVQTQADAVAPMLNAAGHDALSAVAPPVTVGRRRPVPLLPAEPTARPDDGSDQGDLLMRYLDEELGTTDAEAEPVRQVLHEQGWEQPLRVLMGHLWHRVLPTMGRPHETSLTAALEGMDDPIPDSLLFRLARLSLHQTWRWGRWVVEQRQGPAPNEGRSLRDIAAMWPPPPYSFDPAWAVESYTLVAEALLDLTLGDLGPPGDADRVLGATLDCATHRLDPWAVGMGWRRLDRRDDATRVLGMYSFVDRPFRGEPGLGDRGLVLAPSPDQAKTAAILRDRAVTQHAGGVDASRWDAPLDSERVRTALRLARAVREGAHPSEAWGREYERLLPDDTVVRAFRREYAAHGTDGGRRTCDGLAVSRAVVAGSVGADTGFLPDGEVARQFGLLAQATGDLADLLVLEAVHDSVTGGVGQTAVALDAAAGLAAPPELRFPTTVAGGTSLRTTVSLVLPDVADPGLGAVRGPADVDPAVASFLTGALGDPAGPGWVWRAGPRRVSLAELGLTVPDLVGIDDATLLAAVRAALDVHADADVAAVTGGRRLGEARRLIGALAAAAPAESTSEARARLRARLDRVRDGARTLRDELAALPADTPMTGHLATRALRWGLRGSAGAAAERLTQHLHESTPQGEVATDLRRLASPGRALPSHAEADRAPVLVPVEHGTPAVRAAASRSRLDAPWLEVFGRVRAALGGVPEGWAWRAHPDDEPWTGRPDAGGRAREADVAVGPRRLAGPAVAGVLDTWMETLPDRDVPVTGAFAFRTPGARAPQAILLAVPTRDDDDVDTTVARDVVGQAASLARARALPPDRLGAVGALLPSAHLPTAERGGFELPELPEDDFSRGVHARLEPTPHDAGDLDRALEAEVADPVWALARQWQLGEHAGANASSPVEYTLRASHTRLRAPRGRAFADPVAVPGELVLEGAVGDVRVGGEPGTGNGGDPWDASALWHRTQLGVGAVRGAGMAARDHDGGLADWWSLDLGDLEGGQALFTPAARTRSYRGLPGRMRYPGAPEPGWFTLEDPELTVMGHLPDPSHAAALFFLDVIGGHATDWYLTRLPTPGGHVLSVRSLTVRDSFGDLWEPDALPGEADQWTTPFRTRGLGPLDLVAWFATTPPLQGPVLEQVLLGVDEDADLLWAVEERIDGHDAPGPAGPAASASTAGSDQWSVTPAVRYQLVGESPGAWHPYPAEVGDGPRSYRQGRLRVAGGRDGAGRPKDAPLPDPTSRFLRESGRVHEIDPAGVPAGGLRLERRWVLARGRDGVPLLWQQRRRMTPRTAPAFAVGHDRTSAR